MTTNSSTSGFSPFSEYHPEWEGREFTKDEFKKTVDELATKQSNESFIVDHHTVKKATPLTRIWNVLKGFFGFENKTDPVKVNYELLKLLRYAEKHHFLDDQQIKVSLQQVITTLESDKKYKEVAEIYSSAINENLTAEHAHETNQKIHQYFEEHNKELKEPFWTKVFHEVISPVQEISAAVSTNHARIYLNEKKYDEALKSIEQAVEKENTPQRSLLRAEILLSKADELLKENINDSLEVFKQATEAFESFPHEQWGDQRQEYEKMSERAHLITTGLLLGANRIDSAIEEITHVIKEDHTVPAKLLEDLISENGLLGDNPLALGEFYISLSQAIKNGKEALLVRGFNLLTLQQMNNAQDILKARFVETGLDLARKEEKPEVKKDILVKLCNAIDGSTDQLKQAAFTALQEHGKWCIKNNQNVWAKELFNLANSIIPNDVTNIKSLVKLALADSNYEEARNFNNELLKLEDTKIKNWVRGIDIFKQLNEKSEAVALLNRAMKKFPEDIDLIILHFNLTGKLDGWIEKALEAAKKISNEQPKNYSIRRQIGKIYLEQKNFHESRKYLFEALSLVANHRTDEENEAHSEILLHLIDVAIGLNEIATAKSLCDDLLKSIGDFPDIKMVVAEKLFQLVRMVPDNQKKDVVTYLYNTIYTIIVETESPLRDDLAKEFIKIGNSTLQQDTAIDCYNKAFKLGNKEENTLKTLAEWHLENNRKEEAKAIYQLLTDNETYNEEIRAQSRAHLHMINNDYEKALPLVTNFYQASQSNPLWQKYLSICHDNIAKSKAETEPKEAIEHYLKAYNYGDDSLKGLIKDTLHHLGKRLNTENNHVLSIQALSNVLEWIRSTNSQEPTFEILYTLAKSHLAIGRINEAYNYFSNSIKLNKTHEDAIHSAVDLLKKFANEAIGRSEHKKAKDFLLEAQQLMAPLKTSVDLEILKALTTIATAQKNIEDGEKICNQLIETAGHDQNAIESAAQSLYALAQIAITNKEKPVAIRLLLKVYNLIEKTNSPLKAGLAKAFIVLGNESAKSPGLESSAAMYYEKAYTLGLTNPDMLDFLANCSYRSGNFSRAATFFKSLAEDNSANFWIKTKSKARLAIINEDFGLAINQLQYLCKEYPNEIQYKDDMAICFQNIAQQNFYTNPQLAYDNYLNGYSLANDELKKVFVTGMFDLGTYLSNTLPTHAATAQPQARIDPSANMAYQTPHQYQQYNLPFQQPYSLFPPATAPAWEASIPSSNPSFNPETNDHFSGQPNYGTPYTPTYRHNPVNSEALSLGIKALNKALEWIKESNTASQEADLLFEIHYNLAKASIALNQPADSLHHFEEAIAFCKASQLKINNLSKVTEAYTEQLAIHAAASATKGDFNEAKQFYRKAMDLNPSNKQLVHQFIDLLVRLGDEAQSSGNYSQAEIEYSEAIRLERKPLFLVKLGELFEAMKRSKEALALYDEAEKKDKTIKGYVARLLTLTKHQQLLNLQKSAADKELKGDLKSAFEDYVSANKLSGQSATHGKDIARLATTLGDNEFNKRTSNPENYRKKVIDFVTDVTTGEFGEEITKALGGYWGTSSKENKELRDQGQSAITPKEILEQGAKAIELVLRAYDGKKNHLQIIPWQITEACKKLTNELDSMKEYYANISKNTKALVELAKASEHASKFDKVLLNANLNFLSNLSDVNQLVDKVNLLYNHFKQAIYLLPTEAILPFQSAIIAIQLSLLGVANYVNAIPYYREALKFGTQLNVVNNLITSLEAVGEPMAAFDCYNQYDSDINRPHLRFNPAPYHAEATRLAEKKEKPSLRLVKLFIHAAIGFSANLSAHAKDAISDYHTAIALLDQNPTLTSEDPKILKNLIAKTLEVISKIQDSPSLTYDTYDSDKNKIFKKILTIETSTHTPLLNDKWKAWILTDLGVYESKHENFAEARQHFNQALKLNPEDTKALQELSYLDFDDGKFEDLLGRMQNLHIRNKSTVWINNLLAQTEVQMGNLHYLNALYGQVLIHLKSIQNEIQNSPYQNEIKDMLYGWINDWWSGLINAGKSYIGPRDLEKQAQDVLFYLNHVETKNREYLNDTVRDRKLGLSQLLDKIRLVTEELSLFRRDATKVEITKGSSNNFQSAIDLWQHASNLDPTLPLTYINDARAGL